MHIARQPLSAMHSPASFGRRAARSSAQQVSQDHRKDIFIATVAHELRNMIGPLDCALEILDRGRDDPELIERALPVARRQARHMSQLVDELLDIGRMVNDQLVLELQPLHLQQLITESLDASEPMFMRQGQVLSFTGPAEPIWIHGDATRWAQMATNLLHNAAKFTPAGGAIAVSLSANEREAELRVSDNGCGIEPGELESIFGLFKRATGPAGVAAGLGIGLALVRQLVELHGGTVHAESPGPGAGATFVLRVPLLVQSGSGSLERPTRP
jgi:signal transduction histidine kinase